MLNGGEQFLTNGGECGEGIASEERKNKKKRERKEE